MVLPAKVSSAPVSPMLVSSAPVSPMPVSSMLASSAPVSPMPVSSMLASSAPVSPMPVSSMLASSAPVSPMPVSPAPVSPMPVSVLSSATVSPTFLGVAVEMRLKIYRLLLVSKRKNGQLSLYGNQIDKDANIHVQILRTNKQVYNECHSILYQENVFFPWKLDTFDKHVLPQMSPVNRAKIRTMVLEVEGITCIFRPAPEDESHDIYRVQKLIRDLSGLQSITMIRSFHGHARIFTIRDQLFSRVLALAAITRLTEVVEVEYNGTCFLVKEAQLGNLVFFTPQVRESATIRLSVPGTVEVGPYERLYDNAQLSRDMELGVNGLTLGGA